MITPSTFETWVNATTRVRSADELGGVVEPERAVVVERDDPQGRPGARGELLPRDEVGVVLHLGRDDLVARARAGSARAAAPPRPSDAFEIA